MLKEFEIDNSIAQMTEYNKPITCNDPNDGENNQENINCNRNMNKNRIRLTESQLHSIIKESVKQVLSELDWKTYANAANKRQAQGNWQSADSLRDQMVNSFNNKYATSDSEYNSYNGISTNKSASFQMDNGSMGDQGALKFRSQIKQSNGELPQYINRNYRTGLEQDFYNQLPPQGQWHGQHGMTDADKNTKQQPTWSSKVRDKAMQGVYDVDRYHNGQAKYVKGKGWQ